MKSHLTHKELTRLLDYNPETGEFIWKVTTSSKAPAGSKAGSGREYLRIGINKEPWFAHRLAWFYVHKKWPDNDIDHIDGDKLNNRISNLRDIPHWGNQQNRGAPKNNKTGVTGVAVLPSGRYTAGICVHGKRHYKCFDSLEEAIAYRRELEKQHIYRPGTKPTVIRASAD